MYFEAIGLIFRALYSKCEIKYHQKVHALKGSWEFGEGNFIQMKEIRVCSEDSSTLLAGRNFFLSNLKFKAAGQIMPKEKYTGDGMTSTCGWQPMTPNSKFWSLQNNKS